MGGGGGCSGAWECRIDLCFGYAYCRDWKWEIVILVVADGDKGEKQHRETETPTLHLYPEHYIRALQATSRKAR